MKKPYNGTILLMLTGIAGCGKDTVADYLVRHHGFHKFNFASTMKTVCARESHLDESFFYDRDKKDSPIRSFLPQYTVPSNFKMETVEQDEQQMNDRVTPRDLLLSLAARTRREDADYWTKIVLNDIQQEITEKNWKRFVIADCRLHSEVAFMKRRAAASQRDAAAVDPIFDQVSVVWITRSHGVQPVQDNIQLGANDADYTLLNNESPFNGKVVDVLMHSVQSEF